MIDRRHQIIRFWEFAIVATLLVCLWPSIGICLYSAIPFGVFAPVISSVTCSICITETQNLGTVSVTTAGIVNGGSCTDCVNLNRTWSCSWAGSAEPCVYRSAVFGTVCGVTESKAKVEFGTGGGNGVVRAVVSERSIGGTAGFYDSADFGNPHDCSDNTGLTDIAAQALPTFNCNYNSSTATIVR